MPSSRPRLNKLGVRRYEQIAAWMQPDVKRIGEALGLGGRISRENWIEQAQVLAKGGETHYAMRAARGETASAAPTPDEGEPRASAPAAACTGRDRSAQHPTAPPPWPPRDGCPRRALPPTMPAPAERPPMCRTRAAFAASDGDRARRSAAPRCPQPAVPVRPPRPRRATTCSASAASMPRPRSC